MMRIVMEAILVAGAVLALKGMAFAAESTAPKIPDGLERDPGYTFRLRGDVSREAVRFPNRYGIELAADLYVPKNLDRAAKHTAIMIGGPYGGCKEQGAGVYANQLAARGFVVLAVDPPFNGLSGGFPRHVSSPELFSETFSACVDYIGTLPYVDRERIGAIGICGSGGFALSAAQVDRRIKAIATASMYDMTAVTRDFLTDEQLDAALNAFGARRWADFEAGEPEYIPSFPAEPTDTVPEGLDPIAEEFYRYYGMPRGHHPRARANFTTTSAMPFMQFRLLDFVKTIAPRPILIVVGDRAHSKQFGETAYAAAAEPKELFVVEDAEHIDLYDRLDRIPFDKLERFFRDALK